MFEDCTQAAHTGQLTSGQRPVTRSNSDPFESGMSPSLGSSGVLNFPQSFKESSSVHIENQVEAMR